MLSVHPKCSQSQLDSGYVVQASRSSSFGPLSSLRCIWAYAGDKKIYGAFERPPFPILIDTPTYGDVFKELRMADFFMGGVFYGSGLAWGYYAARYFPILQQRLIVYHGIVHMFSMMGLAMMFQTSYRRLTGFWDNGLRWKKPEDRLKKYDCTSHFENATGWHRFRVNTEE